MNNNLKKARIKRIHQKVIEKIIRLKKQEDLVIDRGECIIRKDNSVAIALYFPTHTKEIEYKQNGVEDRIKEEYLDILTKTGYFKKNTEEVVFFFEYTEDDLEKKQMYYALIAEKKVQEWAKINECSICKCEFVPVRGYSLHVYIFYLKDLELKQYIDNCIVEKTKQEFLKILKEIGYMDEFNDNIVFEFGSDEYVQRKYRGSYSAWMQYD